MKPSFLTLTAILLVALNACEMKGQSTREKSIQNIQEPKTLEEVQDYALGEWESISVELRPTEDRTGSGVIQPTFLKRNFKYLSKEKFVGTITLYLDNYGEMPLWNLNLRES